MTARRAALAAVLALGVGIGAASADFETGRRAYAAGDYAIALEAWAPLAAAGDPDAAFGLGLIYDHGYGVGRDAEAAAVWYQSAAEAGHAGAAYNLGNLLRAEDGPGPDAEAAARWWRVAAEAGLAVAQLNLGVAYQKGDGVPQDDAEAFAWYRRAAEGGEPTGALFLGVAYENGVGTQVDIAQAIHWYRRAADAGEPRAAARIAELGGVIPAVRQPEPETVAEPVVAEPTPEPAPAASGATAGTASAFVQIAAYLTRERAEHAWDLLVERYADLLAARDHRIERAVKDDGTEVFRVHVGPFSDPGEARDLCAALAGRGAECFTVERP